MSGTIDSNYTLLKNLLIPGVLNLSDSDLQTALTVTGQLITAATNAVLTFDLENDRRNFISQLKIIQLVLNSLIDPQDPVYIQAVNGDNLYRIAANNLGDALRYADIMSLNSLSSPFLTNAILLKLPAA